SFESVSFFFSGWFSRNGRQHAVSLRRCKRRTTHAAVFEIIVDPCQQVHDRLVRFHRRRRGWSRSLALSRFVSASLASSWQWNLLTPSSVGIERYETVVPTSCD
ncbi:unnamed protein product, partial [Musa acuminata subsp. burmannicoides]